MQSLTLAEIGKWCEDQQLKVSSNCFLYYESGTSYCFTVGLEIKPLRVITLADYLIPTWGQIPFHGALLWIRQRVWNGYSESVGTLIIQQMRCASGRPESLEKWPGQLFDSKELFEMHSYFVVPLLFGWDAFLAPKGKDYFVFASHDGVVGVVCRTRETYAELYERVRDWSPREDREWYTNGIDLPQRRS